MTVRPGAVMNVLATSDNEKIARTAGNASTWPHVLTLRREPMAADARWRWEFEHLRYAQRIDWLAPLSVGPLRAYLPIETDERLAVDRLDLRGYWPMRPMLIDRLELKPFVGFGLGLARLTYSGSEVSAQGNSLALMPGVQLHGRYPITWQTSWIGDAQWFASSSGRLIRGGLRSAGVGIDHRVSRDHRFRLQLVSRQDHMVLRSSRNTIRFEQSGLGIQIGFVYGPREQNLKGD